MINKCIMVSGCHFTENSPIVGNYDYEFMLPFIKTSQDIDISQLTGESILRRLCAGVDAGDLNSNEKILLEDYIQPALVHFSMYRAMNFLLIKPDNSGLVKRNSENGQALELNEANFLADSEKTVAESYGKRLQDYLEANKDLYPEYRQEIEGQIKPKDTPSFTGGLYLGKKNIC